MVTVQWPQWATFQIPYVDLALKSPKCENVKFRRILKSAIMPVYLLGEWELSHSFMLRSWLCLFGPSSSLEQRSENLPWDNEHNRTDIAEYGPTLVYYGTIISWSWHNELRHRWYRAKIGKMVLIVAITALPVSRALAELGFLGRIGDGKLEILLIVFGHWTVTASPTHVIFHTFTEQYTGPITD